MLLYSNKHDDGIFKRRILVACVAMLIASIAILGNIFYLQVIQHTKYTTASLNNRILTIPQVPERGVIYDVNDVALTETVAMYNLQYIAEHTVNYPEKIKFIQTLLSLSDTEMQEINKAAKRRHRPFSPITLKGQLNDKQVAMLAVNMPRLSGFSIAADTLRYYPFADVTAHVLGYVGLMNQQEREKFAPLKDYQNTQYIGKVGLEKFYEQYLHGRAGKQQIEVNARGKILNRSVHTPATPGTHIQLYLDIKLQKFIAKNLAGRKGAVVAIEPSTGGILSLYSNPSYDPNLFISRSDTSKLSNLLNSVDKPFFNRATNGQYPPASTIKPFIGSAVLKSNVIDHEATFHDTGSFKIEDSQRVYHDWKPEGHGDVDLTRAIAVSCDTYFYYVGHALGNTIISKHLQYFSFGRKLSIDLPFQSSGVLPTDKWKLQNIHSAWTMGDNLNTAIGQGYFLVTPLQLAYATTILANQGKAVTPKLLKSKLVNHNLSRQLDTAIDNTYLSTLGHDHWQTINTALTRVVHSKYGTAYNIGYSSLYKIAGKTGTAQVIGIAQQDGERIWQDDTELLTDHSLFIGFAPATEPVIALAVVIENGGSGSKTAAPIAKKIFDMYLQHKGLI